MDVSSQPHALAALPPQKQPPAPIDYEVACASQPVCKFRRKERSTVSDWILTPDHPASNQALYRLWYPDSTCIYCICSHFTLHFCSWIFLKHTWWKWLNRLHLWLSSLMGERAFIINNKEGWLRPRASHYTPNSKPTVPVLFWPYDYLTNLAWHTGIVW